MVVSNVSRDEALSQLPYHLPDVQPPHMGMPGIEAYTGPWTKGIDYFHEVFGSRDLIFPFHVFHCQAARGRKFRKPLLHICDVILYVSLYGVDDDCVHTELRRVDEGLPDKSIKRKPFLSAETEIVCSVGNMALIVGKAVLLPVFLKPCYVRIIDVMDWIHELTEIQIDVPVPIGSDEGDGCDHLPPSAPFEA